MLELARPSLLLAGAAAALLPLLLHLINRRPPERVALPTARFLRPDPRTRLRLDRRPSDLPLLLLRALFVLLLFAALAGPRWQPRREGTAELVLLERSPAMEPFWTDAIEQVRRRLIAGDGGARRGLALFDTAATVFPASTVDAALLDSLAAAGPGLDEPSPWDYATALNALRALADAHPGADSARVTLITRAAWEAWTPGLSALRPAAWPGSLELIDVGYAVDGGTDADTASDTPASRHALVLGDGENTGQFVAAALGALGWRATRAPVAAAVDSRRLDDSPRELLVLLAPAGPADPDRSASTRQPTVPADSGQSTEASTVPANSGEPTEQPTVPANSGQSTEAPTVPADSGEPTEQPTFPADSGRAGSQDMQAILDRVSAGATLLVSGWPRDRGMAEALPWHKPVDAAPRAARAADLVLDAGVRLRGGRPSAGGVPTPDARWLAAWADGRPAGAAAPYGTGCLIYIDTSLEAGTLPLSEAFPAAIERLLQGCEGPAVGGHGGTRAAGPLDEGARATLRADDLPGTAELAGLSGRSEATSLFRWFLVVAALVALLETVLAYGSRREGKSR